MIFKSYLYPVYSNRRPPSLFGEHCEIFATAHMANFEENVEEMVGTTREAAGGDKSPAGRDRRSRGRDQRQDGGDGW